MKHSSLGTIGFVLKGYPRVSETFIAQEIYELEQLGFDIHIFSLKEAREPERQPIVAKIRATVTYIPEFRSGFSDSAFSEFLNAFAGALKANPLVLLQSFAKAVQQSLQNGNKDSIHLFFRACWLVNFISKNSNVRIAHFHSHFAHTPTELTIFAAKLSKKKFSISAHAKDIYTLSKQELCRRINLSELIMTCTSYNYSYMRALNGVDKNKIHHIYHGINLETFAPEGTKSQKPLSDTTARSEIGSNAESEFGSQSKKTLLLSVGRLVEKKGYPDIFVALKRLKEQQFDFNYDIYGDGTQLEELRALAQDLGLQQQIHFHRTTTHPQIIARMKQGGIFICGSRIGSDGDRDGVPNTLAEAMAMELPVVATAVSGIPEIVENEVSGLLVPERNAEALAKALIRLIEDPQLASRLGKSARLQIEKCFDAKKWIHRCADLLRPFVSQIKEVK